MFIDVHIFSYMVRKSFFTFASDRMPKMVVDLGFCIEGQEDEELPEQLLCAIRLSHLQLPTAVELQLHDQH